MEDFYLLDYLKENSELDSATLDILKYELDTRLYYYGNQFKYPFENRSVKKTSTIKSILKSLYISSKILRNRNSKSDKIRILSNAYFSVNEELTKAGYEVFCPSWNLTKSGNVFPDYQIYKDSKNISEKLNRQNFNDLLNEDFFGKINNFKEDLAVAFKRERIRALIVPNDLGFFERILIEVCKTINIPTFIFLHGLPGRYNNIDENRTDYLIVWGDRIKENYIKNGFRAEKIIVSGHPYYQSFEKKTPEFSLEKILVLTKSMCGGQHSDKVRLADRANLIYYLRSIENVLKKNGIKSVKLRMHPSENSSWYLQYIDNDFFKMDNSELVDSIKDSTIIFGPTSTVFLEAIYHGVNYFVYEPSINGIDLFKFDLVPPFDKSDSRVPIATNEGELISIINEKQVIDTSIFHDYIRTQFDLNNIKSIIRP